MCKDVEVIENLILKMVQSKWSTQMGQGWGSGEEGEAGIIS